MPIRSVLFVCLGNICRSPTAEAVMRHKAEGRSLQIDSAGTGGWHVGNPPDPRAIKAGRVRGYDLSPLRGRQVSAEDFTRFDLILAMDQATLNTLKSREPANSTAQLAMFLDFADGPIDQRDVPDPFYGDTGFDTVLDLIEAGCAGLLKQTA